MSVFFDTCIVSVRLTGTYVLSTHANRRKHNDPQEKFEMLCAVLQSKLHTAILEIRFLYSSFLGRVRGNLYVPAFRAFKCWLDAVNIS